MEPRVEPQGEAPPRHRARSYADRGLAWLGDPAEIFFAVYEMAIDTIILAFCEDCSNGGPKFAPPLLMEVMGKTALPEAAAKAEKA